MRLLLLAIYVGLIVAGAVYIVYPGEVSQLKLVASHELPANHLLQPGDLSLFTDGSQYITRKVDAGTLVEANEVAAAPNVTPAKGAVPFSIAVRREEVSSRVVDAGERMLICPLQVEAQVRAVFCGDGSRPCLAIVDIADADAEKMTSGNPSQLSLQKSCG